ncbi:hypothetical protein KIN20_032573 [Parelaphostrongylus tenuis]|uniref:Uncharacterized protein n=1 Tax=Parelaphostrongylus tenuis TaxID=148309 RepID=A0AAD5R6P5_PARTN|nr:hypothetical protein KIN20_032573 [Parelaphostrongylus tenuis]
MPSLILAASKSPPRRLSHLIASLFGKEPENDLRRMWSTTYKKMLELAKVLQKTKKMPGARVYSMRVYDLVMNKAESAQVPTKVNVPPYLKKVFALVNSFKAAYNSRILSPRIAPLVPEKTSQ